MALNSQMMITYHLPEAELRIALKLRLKRIIKKLAVSEIVV